MQVLLYLSLHQAFGSGSLFDTLGDARRIFRGGGGGGLTRVFA